MTKRTEAQNRHGETPRLRFHLKVAWAALFWERFWRAAWLPGVVVGLFLVTALFDLLPPLAGWLHAIALAGFGLALAGAAVWGFRGFRPPTDLEARRRLEIESDLPHRPLTTVQDDIAVGRGDKGSESAWRAHQDRARALLRRLRAGPPRPDIAMHDRFALRGAVVLLLVIGIAVSWGDAGPRLNRIFLPAFDAAAQSSVVVEAWFNPPEYTGEAPRMVSSAQAPAQGETIRVPAGTKVMVQVHGGRGAPRVVLGRQAVTLEPLDNRSFQAELLIPRSGDLIVTQRGREVVDWRIDVREDRAPEIAFARPPSSNAHATMRLDYEASDDYRIKNVRALIARRGEEEVVTLELPVTGRREARGSSYHDLAAHRWAGLEVSILLEVEDDQGQTGRSEIVDFTLPEREFRNPVARAIIEQRRRLTNQPDEFQSVIQALGAIAEQTESYLNDVVVYLALRVSQSRLGIAGADDGRRADQVEADLDAAIDDVQRILWETALRIEDGGLSQRARELARLQRELMERLSRPDIDEQELQQLLDEMERALQDYLQALRDHMRRNPDQYQAPELNQNLESLSAEQLRELMDQMRDMLRSGNTEDLQRLLSELQNLMQGMRQPQGEPLPPDHPAAQMMRELGDIIREQRELQEETFRRHQQSESGEQTDPGAQDQAQEQQEELRRRLGELMRELGEMTGEIPENLGNAERHMKGARRSMEQGRNGEAARQQGQAIQELLRGSQQAMQSLGRAFGLRLRMGTPGGRRGSGQRWWGQDRDPLGRRMDGMGPLNTDDVRVPTESEAKRARDILQELRRRSGERERPQEELDYIERLLRRF